MQITWCNLQRKNTMPGCDLRRALTIAPDWIENAAMLLLRRILMRMIQELDQVADFI